ncbi:XRE family transcriptional regulator [Hymenobacter sp. YC55]|uniref:XRE family transcriptional regulator n=1 Tax=Hymenobacter sp. YC55 TaxID=3034019 RepID=UPI0023F96E83|nr:XRE family transcriptional regulator [Hymenobacter sp. YC55]MDF7810786.1 helix-turn-helix domain-containing protein [Hymenobacter sp. YC55]
MKDTQGSRLKELRERQGLAQANVADAVGLSTNTIWYYENQAQARIKPDMLEKLAKVLKTTPDYIRLGNQTAPTTNSFDTVAIIPDAQYVELPFFNRTAYGSFAVNCMDSLPEEYETMWVLKREGRDYSDARVLEIRGNSMAPRYADRVCVTVRPVQDGDWQYATGVHAMSLRNGMFIIKRITSNKNGNLELTSDSNGEVMTIELGDILCMWKVGEKVYEPAEE